MEASISGYVRRHHLGLVAIFIALTGTAWAGTKVTSQDIKKNAVRAKHVKDGKIGTKEIADGTTAAGLTGADVVPNSLGADDVDEQALFNDDSLNAADIANDSGLGTAEIGEGDLFNDDSLTAADLATDGVGADEIGADAVGAGEVGADAVGAAEVANNTIGSDEIVDLGGIESRLTGDFLTGRLASASDPNPAFFQVFDEFVSAGRSSGGGSNVGFSFDAETLESNFFGDVEIGDSFLEMDQITAPAGNPAANNVWIYARDAAGQTELVAEFDDGMTDQIAIEP